MKIARLKTTARSAKFAEWFRDCTASGRGASRFGAGFSHFWRRGTVYALSFALGLAGCSDRSDPLLHIQANGSLSIQPSNIVLDDGAATRVTVTLRDGAGQPLSSLPSGGEVVWSGFGSNVVAVAPDGLSARLTGLKPGRTVLRASLGTLSTTSPIEVAPVPARAESQGPPVQVGLAGEFAPLPARIQVLDRHGSPVPDVPVSFRVVQGGGGVVYSRVSSDDFGFADTPWILGPDLGLQTVEAEVDGAPTTQLYSYVNGDLASAILSGVSAGGSEGTVGQALPDLLEVRARDAQGRPVLGATVEWTASAGTLLPTSPVTDLQGRARARWVLGPNPGLQTASVRLTLPQTASQTSGAVSGDVSVTFQASAGAAPPTRVSVLPKLLVLELGNAARANVALFDDLGNVVPGPYTTSWSFSDPSIVSASPHPSGDAILAGSRLGQSQVVVSSGSMSDTINVIVRSVQDGGPGGGGPDPSQLTTLRTSPDSLTLGVGQSGGIAATALDQAGALLPTSDAVWSSDDPGVASVDPFGRVSALSVGTTRVRVSLGGLEASTVVTINEAPAPPPPGGGVPERLADVRTIGSTQTSIDVAFTSGHDGNGSPALHELRYAPSPMGWGWGQATVVSSGSCASPLVPTTIGQQMVCRVSGLEPGRSYDFQMVSWRADGPEWIFSPLSNVASGSTLAPSGGPEAQIAQILLSPNTAVVEAGASLQIQATALDAEGSVLDGITFDWTSTNQAVATVDASGRVFGVDDGAVTIRASAGSESGTASIAVSDEAPSGQVSSIVVSPSALSLGTGATGQLSAVAYDASGATLPGVTFSWTSASSAVASVGPTGIVTANGAGSTTIQASAEGRAGSTVVTVSGEGGGGGGGGVLNSIQVSPSSAGVSIGGSVQLAAAGLDSQGGIVGTNISWASSNPSVASVDASGRVTGVSSGFATILASDQGITGTAQISVGPTSSGTPWYRQDWNHANTSAMLSSSEVVNATTGGGSVELLTNAGGPGFDRALRVQFDANGGGEAQAGVDLFFPNAGQDRPREIWFEYYARFSSNWEVVGPYGGSAGHKHLFLFDQSQTGAGRWEHITGLFGDLMSMQIAGNLGPGGQQLTFQPGIRSLWDGNWHRFRCHARMDSSNGTWECEIDGQSFTWGTGNTDRGSQYYFNQMSLSRNLNKGTDRTMTLDFGPVQIFTVNPGW